MNKKERAAPATRSQTKTLRHNRQIGCDCQAREGSAIKIKQSTLPLFCAVSSSLPLKCANEASRGGPAGKARSGAECLPKKGHYRPIAKEFRYGEFHYRQIAREGDIAIYEQRWFRPDGGLSDNIAYEVVRIRRYEAKTFPNGRSSPAREAYPPSEAWGIAGFTLTDKDRAFNKFRQIVAGKTGNTNLEQAGDVTEQEQTRTGNWNWNWNKMKSYKAYSDGLYLKKEDVNPLKLDDHQRQRADSHHARKEPKEKLVLFFDGTKRARVLNISQGDALLEMTGHEDPEGEWIGYARRTLTLTKRRIRRQTYGGVRCVNKDELV